jgi:hypothetical protein
MADLKVGVIGTGFIGPVHIEALRRLGIEVVAVAGPRANGVAEKAQAMHITKYYDTAEALIADPEINVVQITAPNHVHHPPAKAALLAGKHVVYEKPLAMNSAESIELVQLAKENLLVNAVNFNIRFIRCRIRHGSWCRAARLAMCTSCRDRICKIGGSCPPIGTGGWSRSTVVRFALWPTSDRTGWI